MTASSKASSCARSWRTRGSPNSISRRRSRCPASPLRSRCSATTAWCALSAQPIAAVAAKDRKTALAAIAAIKVDSERLPSVIGLDAARKADAPVVFEKSSRKKAANVSEGGGGAGAMEAAMSAGRRRRSRKKAKKARSWIAGAREARNPLLVEGTFRTGTQQHACLEPHAAVARFDGDRLTVHVSTQAVFHLMELIAKRYKLDMTRCA